VIVRVRWLRRQYAFVYPTGIHPPPRTAVLVPCFRSGGTIRVFRGGWTEDARKFAPEAIAATLGQFEQMVRTKIPSLCHSVTVIDRWDDPWLTESSREWLWNAFRVPIFEQLIGDCGELLAADCEAHEGLHIESARLRVGREYIDPSPCACGRNTPRLIPAQQAGVERRVAAAVY
jgi:hypothetical protein